MQRDWRQKLSRPLVVLGSPPRVLTTLNEAGLYLIELVHARGETEELRFAMMQMLGAALSRHPDDIGEVTEVLEWVLGAQRLQ
jgi:hypothetical protein